MIIKHTGHTYLTLHILFNWLKNLCIIFKLSIYFCMFFQILTSKLKVGDVSWRVSWLFTVSFLAILSSFFKGGMDGTGVAWSMRFLYLWVTIVSSRCCILIPWRSYCSRMYHWIRMRVATLACSSRWFHPETRPTILQGIILVTQGFRIWLSLPCLCLQYEWRHKWKVGG